MYEMLGSGFELMMVGMGIVFAFLALLVIIVNIMTSMVQRFFPQVSMTDVTPAFSSTSHTDSGIIAAITAAVHQFRSKNME